jgi:hypothetical protein
MAAYADYVYYAGTFLGTAIASADFPRLALRASEIIDQLTFGRAALETDADTILLIQNATCIVAEKYQMLEQGGWSDGIQSESIGSNSVTYVAAATSQRTKEKIFSEAAKTYLGATDLMFKGFASGEYGGYVDP